MIDVEIEGSCALTARGASADGQVSHPQAPPTPARPGFPVVEHGGFDDRTADGRQPVGGARKIRTLNHGAFQIGRSV
jgi:hypothetical protein